MKRTNTDALLVSQNIMVTFFSGFWGEVILLISFGSMIVGMWFTRTRNVIPLSIAGLVILYISMYVRYSIALEIIAAVILALAYASAYSYNFSKTIKLA